MVDPANSGPSLRWWHRLLEHYTPDGALGRLVLATVTGTGAFLSFSLAIVAFSSYGFVLFLTALLASGVGLAASVLTVLVLWPVYLSFIGNVGSASAYPEGTAPPPSGDRADDPETILKREYARGELTREEFERRLDGLLGADADRPGRDVTDDRRDADAARTRERN